MAIYYLDVDDEITSAAARIRDSSDSRIALVVQGGSRVATSRINFRLLAREARHRNRRLAIVAADASVRSLAQTAGLTVYSSVGEYQKAEAAAIRTGSGPGDASDATSDVLDELATTVDTAGAGLAGKAAAARAERVARPGKGATPRPRAWSGVGLRRLAVSAAILIVIVGGVGAWVLLPSATIVLTLRAVSVGPVDMTVTIDPSAAAPNDATSTVPGVSKEFTIQAADTFPATGQNVVDTAASGTVTFTSANTGNAVQIPAGTQIETAGRIAFATTAAVTVPRATLSGLVVTPATADAPVEAVKKGPAGNVAAGAIVNVPPWLAAALVVADQVTNKKATAGGAHTVTLFVQQSDIDAAEANLATRLGSQLSAQAADPGSVAAGFEIFPRTAALGAPVFDPDPGTLLNQPMDTFGLTASGTGTATTANLSTVRSFAEHKIMAMVKAGYTVVDGSVQISLGDPSSVGAVVSVPVRADALEAASVDSGKLREAVKGKSVPEARAYLSKYGQAEVAVSPFWVSTVPGFDFRIDFQVISPGSAPSLPPGQPAATPRATPRPSQAPPASPSGSSPETTPAATPSPSPAPTPTPAFTPTPAPTPTPTPGSTPTPTPAPTPPPTPTDAASPTATP